MLGTGPKFLSGMFTYRGLSAVLPSLSARCTWLLLIDPPCWTESSATRILTDVFEF